MSSARVTCKKNCAFAFGWKSECRRKRDCACSCGTYASLNPNIAEACIQNCNSSNSIPADEFLCEGIGGEVLYNQYGIQECGYGFEDSAQYQAWQTQTIQAEKEDAKKKELEKMAIMGLGALALILVLNFILNSK